MLVDAQTFRELEIFHAAGGAPSLFDILNRARTAGGRDALLRRFRQPLPSSHEIVDVQDALRFIQSNRATFDLLPHDGQLKTVHNYLHANFTAAQGSGQVLALESYWIQIRYNDIYREARAGVRATFAFAQQLARFLEILGISALPRVLDNAIYAVRSELLESEILSTHAERLSAARVFRLDQMLRGRAREALQELIDAVHELDALVSMADITSEKSFVFPEIDHAAASVEIDGVFHPFLDEPVPMICNWPRAIACYSSPARTWQANDLPQSLRCCRLPGAPGDGCARPAHALRALRLPVYRYQLAGQPARWHQLLSGRSSPRAPDRRSAAARRARIRRFR